MKLTNWLVKYSEIPPLANGIERMSDKKAWSHASATGSDGSAASGNLMVSLESIERQPRILRFRAPRRTPLTMTRHLSGGFQTRDTRCNHCFD